MLIISEKDLVAKTDGYAAIMDRLEIEIEFMDMRARQYQSAVRSLKNGKDRLKDNLKSAMRLLEKTELIGGEYKFKLCRSAPRYVVDEVDLPEMYFKEIITVSKDLPRIKADVKQGIQIPGVHVEENYSLRKSLNAKRSQ